MIKRLKNINQRKLLYAISLIGLVLVLSGCVRYDPVTMEPTGWVYNYFGRPATALLDWIANFSGGSYGVAIIIVTVLTRILMLPSSVSMTKNSIKTQTKMQFAQPEIDAIQEAIDATDDPTQKQQLQAEIMKVHKKYDIDMLGGMGGCLPLILQMPIISAVYAAINTSPRIAESTFFGMHLGATGRETLALVIAVVIAYGLGGWLMQKATPQSGNDQAQTTSNTMLLLNPIMLGYFSFISSAGLGIYFLTGGIFQILQQLYINFKVRPEVEAMMEKEIEKYKNLPKTTISVTPTSQSSDRIVPIKQQSNKQRRRNEGLQNRK